MTNIEIKELRKGLGLSQTAFSKLISVEWLTVSRWERGVTKPSRLALEKIEQLKKNG